MKLRFKSSSPIRQGDCPIPGVEFVSDGDERLDGSQVDFFDSPYINPRRNNQMRKTRCNSAVGFPEGFWNRRPRLILVDLMALAKWGGFSGVPNGGLYEIQCPLGIFYQRKWGNKIIPNSQINKNVIFLSWEKIEELEAKGCDTTDPDSVDQYLNTGF